MYTGACGAAPAGAAVVPSGVVVVGLGGDGWSAVEVGGGAGRRAAFAAAARSTAKFLLPTSQFYLPSTTYWQSSARVSRRTHIQQNTSCVQGASVRLHPILTLFSSNFFSLYF